MAVTIALMIFSVNHVCAEAPVDLIVSGKWTAKYIIQDPQNVLVISQIQSSYFSQYVKPLHRGYELTVVCDISQVRQRLPFKFSPESLPDSLKDPFLLQHLSRSAYQDDAIRILFAWIDRTVPYQADCPPGPDWKSVLETGKSNCVGRALLFETVCGFVNINCRSVSGCIYKDQDAVFHRWVESEYKNIGVMPSEIGVTQDFVDPYHIVLSVNHGAKEGVSSVSELDVRVTKVEEFRDIHVMDARPCMDGCPAGLRSRYMGTRRFSPAVIGTIQPMIGTARVELVINNQYQYATDADSIGNFSFIGIHKGNYQIVVRPSWTKPLIQSGSVDRNILRTHHFTPRSGRFD